MLDDLKRLFEDLKIRALSGERPVDVIKPYLEAVDEVIQKEELEPLLEFDFGWDMKEVEMAFREEIDEFPPSPEVKAFMLWFVGAGPDYPLELSGWTQVPEPLESEWIETYDQLGEQVWESVEKKNPFSSHFLQEVYEVCSETLGEEPLEQFEDGYELNHHILSLYGTAMVVWLVIHNRDRILRDTEERFILYGFHGEGDILVAGRLSRESGWEPVNTLVSDFQGLGEDDLFDSE
jgi:hypothetical protein